MGLIKCPDCEKLFSDRIDACPNCGCPKSEAIAESIKALEPTEEKSTINDAPVVTIVLPNELTVQESPQWLEDLKEKQEKEDDKKSHTSPKDTANKNLSMGWFNYITKVSPWLSIISFTILLPLLIIGLDASINEGIYSEIELAGLILQTIVLIPCIILQIWMLVKSYKKRLTINTMKSYFLWSMVCGALLSENIIVAVVYLILYYFIWYKCNMKYFRKRLPEQCNSESEIKSHIMEPSPVSKIGVDKPTKETDASDSSEQKESSQHTAQSENKDSRSLIIVGISVLIFAVIVGAIAFVYSFSEDENKGYYKPTIQERDWPN